MCRPCRVPHDHCAAQRSKTRTMGPRIASTSLAWFLCSTVRSCRRRCSDAARPQLLGPQLVPSSVWFSYPCSTYSLSGHGS